ncbi:Rrf2 family transcriptional regulator [Paenibacillus campi]|uniref:RrF2 family transcriptional regulator n=1 Tax=Paenibacillus campi TaxID=3106031 RepID=UPI002AFF66CD|nr:MULTISPECIES: Rrf2 family transcriptional regulator [unclassified Paenibacillus]
MKFNPSLEQAICLLVLLATQQPGVPLSSDRASDILGVSRSYFRKITRKLVLQGIVRSAPGNNGGLSLGRAPAEITLLHVIEAMEGELSLYADGGVMRNIFQDGTYVERGVELLNDVFAGADGLLKQYFSGFTLASMMEQSMGNDHSTLNWNTTTLREWLNNAGIRLS